MSKRFVNVPLDYSDGRTKQSMRDECDINRIMAKYNKNGRLPALIKENPIYGDFSASVDLQEAYAIVEKAEMQFRELPAKARVRFKNKPYEFLKFCEDPANIEEMYDMGLAIRPIKEGELLETKPNPPKE